MEAEGIKRDGRARSQPTEELRSTFTRCTRALPLTYSMIWILLLYVDLFRCRSTALLQPPQSQAQECSHQADQMQMREVQVRSEVLRMLCRGTNLLRRMLVHQLSQYWSLEACGEQPSIFAAGDFLQMCEERVCEELLWVLPEGRDLWHSMPMQELPELSLTW